MIKGKESFYSKKLKRVIVCKNGFYQTKNEKEIEEIKKYLEKDKKNDKKQEVEKEDKLKEMKDKLNKVKGK